ncbi:hypothetical protein BB8028_0009g01600 [Beauveria bassiana]|uniref:Uncharacterized protein n=2 Tax=Beauveria bassiana TaxID=176275 RepID=A0A0A2VW11_BEABA|nr:hypothetical protein BBAD15_g2463 [Beauveria bassiana D1-5]PQK17962.1 hypothetical protein BB8028_0009g01600 [Beauveria bassiana]
MCRLHIATHPCGCRDESRIVVCDRVRRPQRRRTLLRNAELSSPLLHPTSAHPHHLVARRVAASAGAVASAPDFRGRPQRLQCFPLGNTGSPSTTFTASIIRPTTAPES